MGYDGKYGRVDTEHGNIPADEPVIVFRARDRHLPDVLSYYAELCATDSPPRHVGLIEATYDEVTAWQQANPGLVRTPDSERSKEWMNKP